MATAVRHTVTRSAVANMPPDARVVSGNVEAVLAYYDPLRGKQQGLGTKLPHAKTRGLPGCACAWPPKHNPDRRGTDYSHLTPRVWMVSTNPGA